MQRWKLYPDLSVVRSLDVEAKITDAGGTEFPYVLVVPETVQVRTIELSCPYIEEVVTKFPESKTLMLAIKDINSRLRYNGLALEAENLHLKEQLALVNQDVR